MCLLVSGSLGEKRGRKKWLEKGGEREEGGFGVGRRGEEEEKGEREKIIKNKGGNN